jgi:hypothetical protein
MIIRRSAMRRPFPTPVLGPLLIVLLLSACDDSGPISPDRLGPLLHISDGSSGGNSELHFLTPLAPGPDSEQLGEPNLDVRPYLRVCETDMTTDGGTIPGFDSADGCVKDVTDEVTGSGTGLVMEHAGDGVYQANWSTGALAVGKHYRIEIWGLAFGMGERDDILAYDERWLFGWRDITNSPSVASCNQDPTQDFCRINYGQTIPVKVRIGRFVFCPEDRNCSFQFVQEGQDATLAALLGQEFVSLLIPGQTGTDFALGFEPCSEAENALVDGSIDLPTFGDCVKTVPQPGTGLLEDAPAVISFCSIAGDHNVNNQVNHRVLHHFSTDGNPDVISRIEAWPHAASCPDAQQFGFAAPEDTGNGIVRFARSVGERVLAWAAPRHLVARSSAARLDVGLGGQGFDLRSFWKAAVPGRFEYESPHFQSGLAGSQVELQARVVDLVGNPIPGATVRWRVDSSPGGAGISPAVFAVTGANGIATATATLSDDDGMNVFHAWGRGIANAPDAEDPGASPLTSCPALGSDGGLTGCNGPRNGDYVYGPFDPFMPLFHPHMDDGLGNPVYDAALQFPVRLASGTLPFEVHGCVQGRGTPTLDGTLGEGEWDCAETRTFPVSLSGGAATATLRWMNDSENFYIAVAVPGTDRQNSLRVEWHRNASGPSGTIDQNGYFTGARTLGADVWEVHPGSSPVARDMFIDNQCSGSSQTNCGQLDSAWGGGNASMAAFSNQAGMTVYELSHPLNSGDTCNGGSAGSRGCHGYTGLIDLSAGSGDTRGFFLSLRMGSGAQGNTVWPGFLQYLAVEIR